MANAFKDHPTSCVVFPPPAPPLQCSTMICPHQSPTDHGHNRSWAQPIIDKIGADACGPPPLPHPAGDFAARNTARPSGNPLPGLTVTPMPPHCTGNHPVVRSTADPVRPPSAVAHRECGGLTAASNHLPLSSKDLIGAARRMMFIQTCGQSHRCGRRIRCCQRPMRRQHPSAQIIAMPPLTCSVAPVT